MKELADLMREWAGYIEKIDGEVIGTPTLYIEGNTIRVSFAIKTK